MTIQVRSYKPSDHEFILSLVPRFSEFDLSNWRTKAEIDNTNRRLLQEAMQQPELDAAIFVAQENGLLAGFVHLQTQTDYFTGERIGYISDVAVEQSFEGRGVGRMLLDSAEEWARGKGYRLLSLYVFAGNTRAKLIYEKFGFQPEVVKYVKPI